jgi:phosphotransferase system HPr (HPr) family protein
MSQAEATLIVHHPLGLHARPAALFVQTAARFKAAVRVTNRTRGTKPVDAKSILSVLTLGVSQGHEIQIAAEGDDADAALAAITDLVESNFGE